MITILKVRYCTYPGKVRMIRTSHLSLIVIMDDRRIFNNFIMQASMTINSSSKAICGLACVAFYTEETKSKINNVSRRTRTRSRFNLLATKC